MSMLARYRKIGGFSQLVNLIETCEAAKQEKLLQLVGSEDPGWAVLVKQKILTTEKIFSWDQQTVMEFTNKIPDRILAIALHCCRSEDVEKILKGLPHTKSREVQSLYQELKPTAAEKHAANIKVIQTVRESEKEGRVKLATIDPQLEINEKLVA